nr:MAG TPA: hypothetical protein [Caudoviricetes sp.]
MSFLIHNQMRLGCKSFQGRNLWFYQLFLSKKMD